MPQMLQVLRERVIGMLTAGMSTKAAARELNGNLSTISCLQRCFREFGCKSKRHVVSQPQTTCNYTSPGLPHPASSPPRSSETSHWTAAATIGLHNQRISAQTVRNRLREAHMHARRPHRGLDLTAVRRRNWLWAGKCSHSMATGTLERCSLHGWIPVFTVQGRWQTVCMVSCGWAVCWCQRCGSSGPW